MNLVGNAIKFTPDGGRICVSARVCGSLRESGEPVSAIAVVDGDFSLITDSASWLEVSIADSGCGIAEEDRERIFQHLYQVDKNIDQKRMGLGLGLCICRDLVSRLGGRIWVDSRVGEGSTFFFTLPAYSAEHAVVSLIQSRLAEAKANGETFAVVEVDADAADDAIQPAWDV